LIKVREFQDNGLIFGALLALKGEIKITDTLSPMIREIYPLENGKVALSNPG